MPLYIGYTSAGLAAGNDELEEIHDSIKNKFKSVQHISAAEFEAISPDKLAVFDVRQKSEYDVSHLAGAIQVSPGISSQNFMAAYSEIARGKTLVFYCSVGQRSSALAGRVQNGLRNSGAADIFNLQGGIFKWYNENRALVNESATTDYVHPYNRY